MFKIETRRADEDAITLNMSENLKMDQALERYKREE